MSLLEKWNKKRFSVFESEEKTTLGLVEELGNITDDVIREVDGKTDKKGNHEGSWQGFKNPVASEPGIQNVVNRVVDSLNSNVNMVGIFGDGTDVTTELQDFLNSRGGGEVFLPKGTYSISATLNIPQNTILKGEGKEETKIIWNVNNNTIAPMISFNRNVSGESSISNLSLDHKRDERNLTDDKTSGAILPCDNCLIENVKITNTIGPGITQAGVENVKIKRCTISNTGHHGIYFSTGNLGYVRNILIEDNIIDGPGQFANRTIGANVIKFRYSYGNDVIEKINIENNYLGTSQDEIDVFISTTNTLTFMRNFNFRNNVINHKNSLNNSSVSFYIGDTCRCENVNVEKNTFNGVGLLNSYGIRILTTEESSNVNINNNTIKSYYYGVQANVMNLKENSIEFIARGVQSGLRGLVEGNYFNCSTDNGVGIYMGALNIRNNTFNFTSNVGTVGIELQNSTGLIISENRIIGANIGINRGSKSLVGCVIRDNTFTNTTTGYNNVVNNPNVTLNNKVEEAYKVKSGTTEQRPQGVYVGELYFDTTLNKLTCYNGTTWV